jgi:SPP1 family phage portal protein
MYDYSVFAGQIKADIASIGMPSAKIIKIIIDSHKAEASAMITAYERYCARKVPIFERKLADLAKVNNKVANNFLKKIVDTKAGYYASKIVYQLDKNRYDEKTYNDSSIALQDFLIRSKAAKLDSQTAKMAGVCGYSVKILYIDNGELACDYLNPWECVFLSGSEQPEYCLRYYTVKQIDESGNVKDKLKVEFYDQSNVYKFLSTENGFVFESAVGHLFDGLPVIQYKNNQESAPDCDASVISLIDAYDIVISDSVNDLEQLSNAYLALIGMSLGANETERTEMVKRIKQGGAFELPEGADAKFITKNINDTFIQNMLNRIEQNIFSFASSVNLNDQNFASNSTGVAMKYKMLGLETVSMLSENEFKGSTYDLFRVASSFWKIKGYNISHLDIYIEMKRNFPLDIQTEATANAMLKGLVSERTRLSLLPFIDDVDYELAQMAEDNEPYDLDAETVTDPDEDMERTETDSKDDLQAAE